MIAVARTIFFELVKTLVNTLEYIGEYIDNYPLVRDESTPNLAYFNNIVLII